MGKSDSAVFYDNLGRVARYAGFVLKYVPGRIKLYGSNSFYREARLNSSGRITSIWGGQYNPDSSINGQLGRTQDSFDVHGNLLKRQAVLGALLSEEIFTFSDGTTRGLAPLYERFEYDGNGNVTKSYIFYLNSHTLTDYGELLHVEYPEYDTKINPTRNEAIRFLKIIQMSRFQSGQTLSFNNPKKIRYHFEPVNGIDRYIESSWIATIENYYNENCFLKYSKATSDAGNSFDLMRYQYECK